MDAKIDKFGRVLIPKKLRDELGLRSGTTLIIEAFDSGLTLRLEGAGGQGLSQREGLLVFEGEATGDLEQAVAAHRTSRMDSFW